MHLEAGVFQKALEDAERAGIGRSDRRAADEVAGNGNGVIHTPAYHAKPAPGQPCTAPFREIGEECGNAARLRTMLSVAGRTVRARRRTPQSRSSSLMPVFARVRPSTPLTIT